MQIRPATHDDLPAILDIYNHAILNTQSVWRDTPSTLEQRRTWMDERLAENYPVIVAEIEGEVAGYAGYGTFRSNTGYWPCVEHTIHVAERFRRRGVASALINTLTEMAREQGKRVMIGAISAASEASLALHASLGFRKVGHLEGIAEKRGERMDLILMQKDLA